MRNSVGKLLSSRGCLVISSHWVHIRFCIRKQGSWSGTRPACVSPSGVLVGIWPNADCAVRYCPLLDAPRICLARVHQRTSMILLAGSCTIAHLSVHWPADDESSSSGGFSAAILPQSVSEFEPVCKPLTPVQAPFPFRLDTDDAGVFQNGEVHFFHTRTTGSAQGGVQLVVGQLLTLHHIGKQPAVMN